MVPASLQAQHRPDLDVRDGVKVGGCIYHFEVSAYVVLVQPSVGLPGNFEQHGWLGR